MSDLGNVQAAVRDILAAIVGPTTVQPLDVGAKLFEQRIVDSLHLVELIDRLESRFGMEIAPEDLTPERFESIDSIARFVLALAGEIAEPVQ